MPDFMADKLDGQVTWGNAIVSGAMGDCEYMSHSQCSQGLKDGEYAGDKSRPYGCMYQKSGPIQVNNCLSCKHNI